MREYVGNKLNDTCTSGKCIYNDSNTTLSIENTILISVHYIHISLSFVSCVCCTDSSHALCHRMDVTVSGCWSLASGESSAGACAYVWFCAIFFLSNHIFYHLETFQECWRRWKECTCFLCEFHMEIHGQMSEVINFDLRKKNFLWKYVFSRDYYSNQCVIKNIMPPDS